MVSKCLIILTIIILSECDSARILVVIPTPSLSHQVVFRPLTQELAKRHEVVVITTDTAFNANNRPSNLTEVDIHDVSYDYFRKKFRTIKMGGKSDSINVFDLSYKFMIDLFEIQLQQANVKKIFSESFDLILIESWFRAYLVFSMFWKAPVIKISSFNVLYNDYNNIGSFEHPMLYPYPSRQKIFNLTRWDEVCELFNDYNFMRVLNKYEESENKMLRRNLGANLPSVSNFDDDVEMLYVNVGPMWGSNRPVPLSVIYIGGIHQTSRKPLPQDLQSYLDASANGVIYVSFGTHVVPSLLPADRMQIFIKVLSQLPYDILFKWDQDTIPGNPENIKNANQFPQTDILQHRNVKLFITQGGLQSTEEAIRSSIPLLGIPMFMDQWYNSERYVQLGIGLKLEFETLTEEQLTSTIYAILNDSSRYRQNMVRLREIINDQPMSPRDSAVWWTEHVLRHGGARHLRSPAANMHWIEYYEVYLLLVLLGSVTLVITVLYVILKLLFNFLSMLVSFQRR